MILGITRPKTRCPIYFRGPIPPDLKRGDTGRGCFRTTLLHANSMLTFDFRLFLLRVYNWTRLGDIVNMHINVELLWMHYYIVNALTFDLVVSRLFLLRVYWKVPLHVWEKRHCECTNVRLALFNRILCRGDLTMGVNGVVRTLVCIVLGYR